MEDLAEFGASNVEQFSYAGAGLGVGALTMYLTKYQAQRNGKDPFQDQDPREDWREQILEEDPLHEDGMYEENTLMELYYDNFDALKRNAGEGFHSFVTTLILDGLDTYAFEGDRLGLDQYPETIAGIFAGMKIGKKIPTPVDVSNLYQKVVSGQDDQGDRAGENF